jgi:hypothetical protein
MQQQKRGLNQNQSILEFTKTRYQKTAKKKFQGVHTKFVDSMIYIGHDCCCHRPSQRRTACSTSFSTTSFFTPRLVDAANARALPFGCRCLPPSILR